MSRGRQILLGSFRHRAGFPLQYVLEGGENGQLNPPASDKRLLRRSSDVDRNSRGTGLVGGSGPSILGELLECLLQVRVGLLRSAQVARLEILA